MPGIGGDGLQASRRRGLEERRIVDHGLVLEGDVGDRGRQGEDDVEVSDIEEVGLGARRAKPRAAGAGTAGASGGCGRSS